MKTSSKSARTTQKEPSNTQRVYCLTRLQNEDGSTELIPTPEQVAVAIAKCSRSDSPFDENLREVTLENAASFHEKWVVGYGHGSVAEHAVASVAFERISQVVIKILEDSRLASYTEKSSRYVVFTRDLTILPESLKQGEIGQRVNAYLDRLYRLYDDIQQAVRPMIQSRFPRTEDISERAYEATTKARVCDIARYCLPAAAAGNLGMTANARVWAHVITKLASSPHEEAQKLAETLLERLRKASGETPDEALQNRLFPTLLKYAGFNSYMAKMQKTIQSIAQKTECNEEQTNEEYVTIIKDDAYAELRIASALLARYSHASIAEIQEQLSNKPEYVEQIIREAVRERGEHDQLPREFEHATFQHEIIMDYGAWRDVQRHRMCSQINQNLSTHHGYIMPEEIREVGLEHAYRSMMSDANRLYNELCARGLYADAEYIVPMAYKRRLIISWNVRELDHFITLRSSKKGHASYRKIAQELWKTLEATHPLLASMIKVDMSGNEESLSTLGAKPKGF